MAYRGYTQAQNKATQKYHKEHLEQIAIRVKKGTRDRWHDAADAAGESYAQYIVNAVETRIAGEKNLPETQPETSPTDTENPMRL